MRFWMVMLFELVTTVAEFAMRIPALRSFPEPVMDRFRFVPGVFGLSPSIVTLSAPFSWMTPKPGSGDPPIVTPSVDGRISTEVYDAVPAPLLFRVAGVVPSFVLATILIVTLPWCVPALMASNAPLTVVYDPAAVPADAVTVTSPTKEVNTDSGS